MPAIQQTNLLSYSSAGYPAVAIATSDEDRTISNILAQLPARPVWRIAATGGLISVGSGRAEDAMSSYPKAFGMLAARKANETPGILVVLDFQHIIRNPGSYRMLRDTMKPVKANGGMIVLIAPSWQIPPELEHDIPVMHDSLPSREELTAALQVCVNSTGATIDDATRTAILDSASGLTLAEAEGSMALSYDGEGFSPEIVAAEKMKLVRQSGKLEVSPPANIADLGGLGGLKAYINQEVIPTMHEPDLRTRGIMLVGVPGTGKSLAARVTGAMLGWPVLRADIGALKGSLQGQSEGNMHAMLKLAEAVSPVVLYLDECEKGVGGHGSSAQTDGGVTLGMIGILLTWLAEHNFPIITIATANDYAKLPAEFTRAGRFDERLFVDLPTSEERTEIAMVHLRKFGADQDACAERASALSSGWTGAEIEQLVRSAARRTRRQVTPQALTDCAVDIKPISIVRAAEIQALRDWGRSTLRLANTPELEEPVATGRKIRAGRGVN